MKIYDAAFVPCREPNPITGEFTAHHIKTLERVLELQQAGAVGSLLLSGRHAARYSILNIVPWFGAECDASADLLIKQGCSPDVILRDRLAEDSIANNVFSGENFFVPMLREKRKINPTAMVDVLVVAAEERLPRLEFLGNKILDGVVNMDFESIGPATDEPWLARKEPFTLAMTERYLADVPNGPAGWPLLKSWFYTEGMYPFWMSFDAAQQAMPPAPQGTLLNISDIVASMDRTGLPPDIMEFAAAIAHDQVFA